jgi:hypothetical protein
MLKRIVLVTSVAASLWGAETKPATKDAPAAPVISDKALLRKSKVNKQNAQLRLMIEQQFGEAIKKIQADDQSANQAMQADCDVAGIGKYQVREVPVGSDEYACVALTSTPTPTAPTPTK